MGQLIKVTTEPLQVIRFTQKARLVPSDHIDMERRKAMAQYHAFNSSHRGAVGSTDLEYMNKINDAFSSKSASVQEKQPVSPNKPAAFHTNQTVPVPSPVTATAPVTAPAAAPAPQTQKAPSVPLPVKDMQAAYTMQRGSLELRVAKGELSFLPPLVMTIITQYPEIQFEYIGGFRYVPPQRDTECSNINLYI